MKISIKNLLFQPLALHLATDGEGLHLTARECRDILAQNISQEIQLAAARGLVSLMGKPGEAIDHALGIDSSEPPQSPEPTAEPQAASKKGKAK